MCSSASSINYDLPASLDEMEEYFQPENWPLHKEAWLNYMEIRDTFFQDDDIIVTTFPRSGTHLSWYMVDLLLNGANFESDKYILDDLHIIHQYANLYAHPGPVRTFHTHMKPCDIGYKALLTGNLRVVHMIRDPKDTALSLYNLCFDMPTYFKTPTRFEEWAINFCTNKPQSYGHTWVHHARSWEDFAKRRGAQVCCVTFEDFVKRLAVGAEDVTEMVTKATRKQFLHPGEDKRDVLQRVSAFLKLNRTPEEIDQVADKLSFNKMKQFKQNESIKELMVAAQTKDASFYKKGKIGSWKEAFTVELSERFDAEIRTRMEGSKFYSVYC